MTKTVLIFHPDLEYSLVRFQKELTQKLNQTIFSKQISEENKILNENRFSQPNKFLQPNKVSQSVSQTKKKSQSVLHAKTFFYAPLPLWLELNHDDFFCKNKSQLKKLAADIKKVSLLENLKIIENSVYITAKIVLAKKQNSPENSTSPENCEFFFDLPVSTLHNCKNITGENLKIIKNTKNPIKNIKIFRLGICRQISKNAKEIEDFVWAKKNS